MQITEQQRLIIGEGKLKTYYFGRNFTEVYWQHSALTVGSYYLFRFTGLTNQFIEVIVVRPKSLYVKQNPKVFQKRAEELVKAL